MRRRRPQRRLTAVRHHQLLGGRAPIGNAGRPDLPVTQEEQPLAICRKNRRVALANHAHLANQLAAQDKKADKLESFDAVMKALNGEPNQSINTLTIVIGTDGRVSEVVRGSATTSPQGTPKIMGTRTPGSDPARGRARGSARSRRGP